MRVKINSCSWYVAVLIACQWQHVEMEDFFSLCVSVLEVHRMSKILCTFMLMNNCPLVCDLINVNATLINVIFKAHRTGFFSITFVMHVCEIGGLS